MNPERAGDWLDVTNPRPSVRFPLDTLPKHEHHFPVNTAAGQYYNTGCPQCGVRLLHLWLNSRDWVRRRTESVEFIDDRTVRRRVTVDFLMPPSAPALFFDNRLQTIVPIVLLKKKSLTNFDLRDEGGNALSLLELRQQQALTVALLTGVVMSIDGQTPAVPIGGRVQSLLNRLVFGDPTEVYNAMSLLKSRGEFEALRSDWLFLMTCERLEDNWIMFLQLPPSNVTRRIVKFAYDEPLDLHFQPGTSGLRRHKDEPRDLSPPAYVPQVSAGWERPSILKAELGLDPIRIRFPISSADSAQSFHLEVTAPPGTIICSGQALTSRPDQSNPEFPIEFVSDCVSGVYPTVDLHLVDVPNGSFAEAQVELRAQSSGWLWSMTIACWVNTVLLFTLAITELVRKVTAGPETDVTLLIVFVTFASAVLMQQDAHPMLGRLLRRARAAGGISTVAALVGAGLVALTSGRNPWLFLPAAVSLGPALLLSLATRRSLPRETARREANRSRWDFTNFSSVKDGSRRSPTPTSGSREPPIDTNLFQTLSLDKPAIRVATSEGVRERTRWSPTVAEALRVRICRALELVPSLDGSVVNYSEQTRRMGDGP
jgi:hypothetical protein